MSLPVRAAVRRALRRPRTHQAQPPAYVFANVHHTDTYLVSFPRSGNTWLRCLLTALIHDAPITPELLQATVPDVHRSDRAMRPPNSSGLVKSHTPFVVIPARVVYLVRDGRDAMLSYWAHQVALGHLDADEGPGRFILSPDVWPCPWHEHVQGWLDGSEGRPHTQWLLLRYEDLVADPAGGLARAAEFTGLSASRALLADAVRRGSRRALAQVEAESGPGSFNHVSIPRPSWQDALSDQDATRFMTSAGPVLRGLGYDLA